MSDKENAVQQAQVWAQEARTQRAIVLSILRYFGLPERDYEALTLIQAKDSEGRVAMLKALDALETADNGLKWYQDHHPEDASGADDEATEQIQTAKLALQGALANGVKGAPDA